MEEQAPSTDRTPTPGSWWWVKSRRAQSPEDYETWIAGGVSPTLNAFDNGTESRATVVTYNLFGGNARPDRPEGGFYVNESKQSKTLDANSGLNPSANQGGTAVLASTVRRLTPMECERLQGFPDGWTDGQADSTRYRQMGNAVAVPVFEWVMARLVAVDESLSLPREESA